MPDPWVVDTSSYTHLCRAGHADLFERLAPGGIILIPTDVDDEIEVGRQRYGNIPAPATVEWAQHVVLNDDELMVQLTVKANMGGDPRAHIGECAVVAYCSLRGFTAILDERAAIVQAELLGVVSHDTLWVVVEAFKKLEDIDRGTAEGIVDDLLATGMYLPVASGAGLFAWAYTEGLLP